MVPFAICGSHVFLIIKVFFTSFEIGFRNIGFCGEPMDITAHAIQLLHQQDLISFPDGDNKIKPKLSNINQALLFYQHSLKVRNYTGCHSSAVP